MGEIKNISAIKKVLMTADTLGGVWTYSLTLAESLGRSDIHVFLATMGRRLSAEQRSNAEKIPNLTVIESDYKLEWMQDPWSDIEHAGDWLLRLERELEPDIIHLNSYVHGSWEWNSPVLITAHSDVFSWFRHVKNSLPSEEWNTYHKMVEKGLRLCDHVVAITAAVAADLKHHYSFSTSMSVLYNGLSPRGFTKRSKEDYIFSVGRIWDEAKNYQLLNAAAENISFPVYVAGENHHPENGTKSDFSNLIFTGLLSRQEVMKKMSEAAVYCLPARYEPFGYTPLEAAFSGCALLLADIDSLTEIWQDTAFYFDPEDPNDLSEKLELLCSDPNLCQLLGERAKKRAQEFTADKMVEPYVRLYEELIMSQLTIKTTAAYEN